MANKHYPPEFWKWLAGLTKTWEYKINKFDQHYLSSKAKEQTIFFSDFNIEDFNIQDLQSLIYQAIDGLNDKKIYYIKPYAFSGVDVFKEFGFLEHFPYCSYPTKTDARLDALHWVWERSDNA